MRKRLLFLSFLFIVGLLATLWFLVSFRVGQSGVVFKELIMQEVDRATQAPAFSELEKKFEETQSHDGL